MTSHAQTPAPNPAMKSLLTPYPQTLKRLQETQGRRGPLGDTSKPGGGTGQLPATSGSLRFSGRCCASDGLPWYLLRGLYPAGWPLFSILPSVLEVGLSGSRLKRFYRKEKEKEKLNRYILLSRFTFGCQNTATSRLPEARLGSILSPSSLPNPLIL